MKKAVHEKLVISTKAKTDESALSDEERQDRIALLTEQMQQCARELEFEQAARLRDEIRKLSGLDASGERKAKSAASI